MVEELHIHERLNKALDILNGLEFQGYHEITAIAPNVGRVMSELIVLEQKLIEYEQTNAVKATEEPPHDEEQHN
jgi:hypothetical protein